VRHVDEGGIEPIREHAPKALRIHDRTGTRSESAAGDGVEDFLFRETTSGEFLALLRVPVLVREPARSWKGNGCE
jgi:hypothetical protein